MNRIVSVFKIFGAVISCLRYGKTALPLLAYFLLKVCLIFAYASSSTKPLASLWALLKPGMSPETLTHYPEHLLLMPIILGRLDIPLEIFLLVLAQGATVLLVAACARRERLGIGASLKGAGGAYLRLVIPAAIASAAIFAGFRYPVSLLDRLIGIPQGLEITLSIFIGVVIQAFFLYAIPFVLLENRGALGAIARSCSFAARNFLESFLLAFVPFILTIPILLLSLNPRAVVFQISPEFLMQIQIAGEVMQLATTYLLMGGLTIYFLETRFKGEKR